MSALTTLPPDLLEDAQRGDRQALDRLLVLCRPDLQRYARRHCEADDIDEAVQDALWIMYRRVGTLRTMAAFASWTYQVVKRACLRYLRMRRGRPGWDTEPFALESQPDPNAPDSHLRARLISILARMPRDDREVLLLKDVQGCSADELAAALRVSSAAAKSRLHRARRLVRDELAKEEASWPGRGALA